MTYVEAVVETGQCPTCNKLRPTKVIEPHYYFCDECDDKIDEENTHIIDVRLFSHGNSESEKHHFCSWSCFSAGMKSIKGPDDFITLPFIHCEGNTEGPTSFQAFKEILK